MNAFSRSILGLFLLVGSVFTWNLYQPAGTVDAKFGAAAASPTPQNMRIGYMFKAAYMAVPPNIDGDWSDLPATEYALKWIVYGQQAWTNSQDLQGSFRAGWDESNLYLAVKVIDNVYVQNARVEQLYKGDSLELLFDGDLPGDYSTTSMTADDYQIGISGGRPSVTYPSEEAYIFFPVALRSPRPEITVAATRANRITRYEVAIPWSTLGVTPEADKHYGFVLNINDNDDDTRDVQQTVMSNVRKRVLINPVTWGDLRLMP
jgi:hypothetical protein